MKNIRYSRETVVFSVVISLIIIAAVFGLNNPKAENRQIRSELPAEYAKTDQITETIRHSDREFIRVEINSLEDRAKIERAGKLIEDYGSFVIAAKNKNADVGDLNFQKMDTSINPPGGKFEPLTDNVNAVRPNSEANANVKNYYIVQFGATAKDEWLESLRATGAEIVQYLPQQAFIVYADGITAGKIAAHSRVRWVGEYTAEMKIPALTSKLKSNTDSPTARFDVAVFSRAELLTVRNQIANVTGGEITRVIQLPHNFFNIVQVEIPVNDIQKIAGLNDVVEIDPYIPPTKEDERAAQIVAGNYTSQTAIAAPGYNPLVQFGADGTNVTVSVSDDGVSIPGNGGFYLTSANTLNGPLRGATAGASGGHGHINAGIIAGSTPYSSLDPLGYNYGLGIAPKANIINLPFLKSGYTGADADFINDTLTTAGVNGVNGFITNNSWGSGTNSNSYDSYAAQYDGYVQDGSSAATIDPILIVFSAGNSGTSGLTRPKMAKNVIAVGNSENLRTEISSAANNIDDLAGTSSRGPAADGRIKPDIVAPGTIITGSRAGDGSSVSGSVDANVSYSSGTSHAAPQVAGAAALFTQFWKAGHGGQNPSPALVKAAVINTGQEMNGVGTNTSTIPNGNEGWGRINLKYMLNTGVPMKYVNQETTFTDAGNTISYTGAVGDATKPFRVSLVWTDPPGISNPALVNNLNLTVTIGGSVYRGNVFTGGVSTTGGNADTVNNVENIILPAGIAAGTPVVIKIDAAALNGNGDLSNSDPTDQHFSLVAYNFGDASSSRAKVSDFDGDGKSDIAVYRPSNGGWYILRSSDSALQTIIFGTATDTIVPGDYDGDGKTDAAVYRSSTGIWYLQRSTAGFAGIAFGTGGDLPTQADFDGDGKTDVAVYRPSNHGWYILNSTNNQFSAVIFGTDGDKPVAADYDGDGKADVAVFRPSNATWYLNRSSQGFAGYAFGLASDKLAPADYDGDGKSDLAVYRDGTWYIQKSTAGFSGVSFGVTGDIPAAGDYDGDGKADITVYRGNAGTWYRLNSSNGAFAGVAFGLNNDQPVAAAVIPVQ